MAKAVIYDYIEGLVEFKKRIPEHLVVDDGSRYIIDVGYDTALKIMLRNTMYDLMVKPAELARRIGVTRQQLNKIFKQIPLYVRVEGSDITSTCQNLLLGLWDQFKRGVAMV